MSGDTPRGNSLVIVAAAALAAFGAVYLTMTRPDNGASPAPTAENVNNGTPRAESSAEPRTEPKAEPSAGAPEKTGQMAAFVRKKSPEALPEITFNDAAGQPVTLAGFKGRTVLLNLWATWCAPCREEMGSLDRLQQALGSGKFEVVALSLDRQGAAASQKFLDEVNAKHLKLYIDATAKQGTVLKIVGMPTTILINKDGLEIGRLAGPAEWDSADAKALIKAAME